MKILIIGSNDRASLVIARSLGRERFTLDNISFTGKTITNYSRYIRKSFYLNNINNDFHNSCEKLFKIIKDEKYDYIIPVNDTSNELVYFLYERIEQISVVLGPNPKTFEKAKDKRIMLELCKSLKIPVPETEVIEAKSFNTKTNFNYPVYLKPSYSSNISSRFLHSYGVRKIKSLYQLESFIRDNNYYSSILVQKEYKGFGVGVNILAKEGDIISYTVHKRINEPNDGGGSSYRKSIKLDPLLNEYCKKLCKAINYTGVLMIEFKKSSGIYYFMEINPRFWGSLELSINSNINFPLDLLNLFKNDNIQKPLYVSERYSRHFYKDLGWVIQEIKNKNNPIIFIYWLYSFKNLFLGKESFDVEKHYDLKPMFAQYFLLVLAFFEKIKRKQSILFRTPKRANLSINNKTKVLFVCKGNINRSAFAEIYLTSKGFKNVKSAGTINREGRKSSSMIEKLSKEEYSMNMSDHRSRYLKESDLLEADIVFYFDNENFYDIKKRFPNQINKVYFIGCLTQDIVTVKDPFNGTNNDYKKVASQISSILDNFYLQ
jgi:protein-tyrosine-phosphatase/predicted ATP-grasp superfamily ATP-dependent carboligase